MVGIRGIGFWLLLALHFQALVPYFYLARLAIQFEEDGAVPIVAGFAQREEFDDKRLAFFNGDCGFFAPLHAEEELGRRQNFDVAIGFAGLYEILRKHPDREVN